MTFRQSWLKVGSKLAQSDCANGIRFDRVKPTPFCQETRLAVPGEDLPDLRDLISLIMTTAKSLMLTVSRSPNLITRLCRNLCPGSISSMKSKVNGRLTLLLMSLLVRIFLHVL